MKENLITDAKFKSTKLIKKNSIATAAEIIKNEGTVAMPTETVYGLGADATNQSAVAKIFEAKGRPSDNPLIVHFHSVAHVLEFFPNISPVEINLLRKIKSGLTLVVPYTEQIRDYTTSDTDEENGPKIPAVTRGHQSTVAIRIPNNKIARKLIKLSSKPIAAPSANTSTRPSPTTWQHVESDLNGKIDAIIMSGTGNKTTKIGIESTVVKLVNTSHTPSLFQSATPLTQEGNLPHETKSTPLNSEGCPAGTGRAQAGKGVLLILRNGGVSKSRLEKISGLPVKYATDKSDKDASPGTRYKHYSPSMPVKLFEPHELDKILLEFENTTPPTATEIISWHNHSAKYIMKNLFKKLREAECELNDVKENYNGDLTNYCILIEKPPTGDEYMGIWDRISKIVGNS